jgi:hypothetical protein
MQTLHQPPDSGTDPAAARYFRMLAVHEAVEEEAARRGLPPVPWAP